MQAKLIHCARTITRKQNKLEGQVTVLVVICPFLNTTLRLKGVNYERTCSLIVVILTKICPFLWADVVELHDPYLDHFQPQPGKNEN